MKHRYRYIATLIIGYFIHGALVQFSRDTGPFSERSTHAMIMKSLESGPISKSDWPGHQNRHNRLTKQSNNETRMMRLKLLRYAAFGTSRTWGSGLEDPQTQSYIKLLSPNGANFGLRATAADYPSICLYSMVGDDQVYDVVILEFTASGTFYHTDFERLARRVRARFPSAVIIYLPLFWLLHEVHYRGEQLFNHLVAQGIKSPSDPAFEQFINNLPDSELKHADRKTAHSLDLYEETLRSIGGYMIKFPIFEGGDLKRYVLDNVKYIGSPTYPMDDNHPSTLGHRRIAEMIQELLQKVPFRSPSHAVVGGWLGGKDSCVSWFSRGNAKNEGEIGVSNMTMNPIAHEGDKWAWEVAKEGGTITVNCRSPPCDVYIGHMASTHHENYPKVTFEMKNETTIVNPLISAPFPQNVNLISRIGRLHTPGKATLIVRPFLDKVFQPFRITGVLVSPALS